MVPPDIVVLYDALTELLEDSKVNGRRPLDEWSKQLLALERQYPELYGRELVKPYTPPTPTLAFTPPTPPTPPTPMPTPPTPMPPTPPMPSTPPMPPLTGTSTVATTISAAASSSRVSVLVDVTNMNKVASDVLRVWGERFYVFRYGGNILVEMCTDTKDPSTQVVESSDARRIADLLCAFGSEKQTKDGVPSINEIQAPDWLGSMIVTRPHFPEIPPLHGVARAPTLRNDGALIAKSGYEPKSGIYLVTDLDITIPDVITQADAKKALDLLLDVICDYPFALNEGESRDDHAKQACRTAWVAAAASAACRYVYDGPTPLMIADASKAGSGKSTLVNLIHLLVFGNTAPPAPYSRDNAEMSKTIISLGLSGAQTVLLDNIKGKLDSEPLEAALTSTRYTGRLLGRNEQVTVDMRIVWFVTANGMSISSDIARRSIIMRLEPDDDDPARRDGPVPGKRWKHDPIDRYVLDNRRELLAALLTLVAGYIRADSPNMKLRSMGSYSAWSMTIRSAIVWAGGADPCITAERAQEMDPDKQALERLIAQWPSTDETPMTVRALIDMADTDTSAYVSASILEKKRRDEWREALLDFLPPTRGELPTPRELGNKLGKIRSAPVAIGGRTFKLEAGKRTEIGTPWFRVQIGGPKLPPGNSADGVSVPPPAVSLVK